MPIIPHRSRPVKVGNRGQWSMTRQPRNLSDLQLKVEYGLRYLGIKYDTKEEAVKIPKIKHIRSQPDIVIPRIKGKWGKPNLYIYVDGDLHKKRMSSRRDPRRKDAEVNEILDKHGYNYKRFNKRQVEEDYRWCIQKIIERLPQKDRKKYHAILQRDSTAHTKEQRRKERVSMAFNKLGVLEKLILGYKNRRKYTVVVANKKGEEFCKVSRGH